jgi:hypothetical protein
VRTGDFALPSCPETGSFLLPKNDQAFINEVEL